MSRRQKSPNATPREPVREKDQRGHRYRWGGWLLLGCMTFGVTYGVTWLGRRPPSPTPRPGMVWIPGGEFVMGSEDAKAPRNEHPAHRVRLDDFWMDDHEVTNAEFRQFVEETGYVTTAEQTPDWEQMKKSVPPGTPKPPDEVLVPGALVFTPTEDPVATDDASQWWRWTPGACWRHPEGPQSDLEGRDNHPVVQVSWDDAVAYARWAGKRLPTEAEWEYAARGGLTGKKFTWGDAAPTDQSRLANIWQGNFPDDNTQVDGWDRTAPVKSFPPNGYQLYDMGGNVWEWCADWYRADEYDQHDPDRILVNPQGPSASWDPREPYAPKRVTRGGSFLCHVSYCESYRPAARRGTDRDTGLSHVGFRCVISGQSP
ncbi:MAG: formylglycine-generating enzyme family protein [Planctomycetales bacterium]